MVGQKNFDVKESEAPSIRGSNYNETFNLLQFHFHWGKNSKSGIHLTRMSFRDLFLLSNFKS